MKKLLTGNEAVARGAFEAGVHFASSYPGTPSTEIAENLSKYSEIYTEWSVNEKVAVEGACGASAAGARAIVSMKHVGMNVAADPIFTFSYMGACGGLVIVTCDEPGQFSSQNEQDNRNYAKMAKLPLLEPSDSAECLSMTKEAFYISEKFKTPVIIRLTTRVCHSKSPVTLGERKEVPIKEYEKDIENRISVPAFARKMRVKVEKRLFELKAFAEKTELNKIIENESSLGVIASGMCFYHAREIFKDTASYLKLGFTNPMPEEIIKSFCKDKKKIYVIEENDPFIKDTVKALGFKVEDVFPPYGEMTPDVLRKSLGLEALEHIETEEEKLLPRPPLLCAGCPHRGVFYSLGKRKDIFISGDIGCYTLGFSEPFNAMDMNICMGASISAGHGAEKIFKLKGEKRRVVSVIGDSTFFHTGINSLINTVYNKSATVNIILDNRVTGMTGHQDNPGTGYDIKGQEAPFIDIARVCEAVGVKHIFTVDPTDLKEVNEALDKALKIEDEPSVIIARYPCVLKKLSERDKSEFPDIFKVKFKVTENCVGCKTCLSLACPAVSFHKKAVIRADVCTGCSLCSQVCPVNAIVKEEL